MCLLARRVEADGIIIVGHCAEIVVQVIFHIGAVDKVARIARLQHDGTVHVSQGALKVVARAGSDLGPHHIGTRIVLAQCDAAVQIVKRPCRVTAGKVHLSQADEGTVVAPVQTQETLKSLLSVIIILQGTLAHGAVQQQVLILGHEFKTRVIVLDCSLEVTQVLARHATHLIGIDDKRVALDGHGCILLGTTVILQADLGHRTVEVGLGQKGLSLNSLVKILDRKDVVLKVKGIATDVYHLLGVDLRLDRRQYCQCSQQQHQ